MCNPLPNFTSERMLEWGIVLHTEIYRMHNVNFKTSILIWYYKRRHLSDVCLRQWPTQRSTHHWCSDGIKRECHIPWWIEVMMLQRENDIEVLRVQRESTKSTEYNWKHCLHRLRERRYERSPLDASCAPEVMNVSEPCFCVSLTLL